jgi:hypothetical protein
MILPVLFSVFAGAWILLLALVLGNKVSVKTGLGFLVLACVWTAYFSVLGASGVLKRFPDKPVLLAILIPILLVGFLLGRTRLGLPFAGKLSLRLLIGLQAFRIGVELFLHQLYHAQLVPRDMTFLGRNFDILTGVTALGMAAWMSRAEVSRRWLLIWNFAGLALLANVVMTGILSAPGPLQKLNFDAPNLALERFPYVLVAGVFVASALWLHVLTFRKLRLERPGPATRMQAAKTLGSAAV